MKVYKYHKYIPEWLQTIICILTGLAIGTNIANGLTNNIPIFIIVGIVLIILISFHMITRWKFKTELINKAIGIIIERSQKVVIKPDHDTLQ